MRKDRDNKPYLRDILESILLIEGYIKDAPNLEEFTGRRGLYQDAIVRNIEIIGEATKKIDDDFKALYPKVPWRQIAGMRDKLIHEYADVDWEEVWKVATTDVKKLKEEIQGLLQEN